MITELYQNSNFDTALFIEVDPQRRLLPLRWSAFPPSRFTPSVTAVAVPPPSEREAFSGEGAGFAGLRILRLSFRRLPLRGSCQRQLTEGVIISVTGLLPPSRLSPCHLPRRGRLFAVRERDSRACAFLGFHSVGSLSEGGFFGALL